MDLLTYNRRPSRRLFPIVPAFFPTPPKPTWLGKLRSSGIRHISKIILHSWQAARKESAHDLYHRQRRGYGNGCL